MMLLPAKGEEGMSHCGDSCFVRLPVPPIVMRSPVGPH